MKTPSHFLMTAALDKALPRVPIVKSAFLLGSVAPDIPLWVLSISGIIYYHLILGWSLANTFHLMFDQLYFYNPAWIAFHNLLHSPVLLVLGLGLVWRRRRNIGSHERWLFWFLLACLFHAVVDIFTHTNDGPLLFFPLEWSIRFHSPISYWDWRYHGREFARFELALDSVLLIYLLASRFFFKRSKMP
ncbi:MAG: metal-dependent hydrolase [Nostoc sp. DedVER02]|uniref:metal-dependent hydrolase n=1 Tax=unclassified Nostoc TaxID=2593658 RepID=UPI002AD22F13|nr:MULTISPECIES: metal-dependent hydrolase [unclassified Nostoc]MDZ7989651.1 zinc dependent phospholipase C family protein [Nostoc sp. DedVER02]MDZ8113387.1 zinc dependent phospholipase C family protein [Nostoc sp. DedVER01b]